jgi:hypothetical protein
MKMKSLSLTVTFFFTLTTLFLVIPADSSWASKDKPSKKHAAEPERKKVVGWEFIGEVIFPTGYIFEGTEVGGLSGITYDPKKKRYFVLSDDRSEINPARFYSVSIDLADGQLDPGDIEFTGVTTLKNEFCEPFSKYSIDPEGIVLTSEGKLFIASAGDANRSIDPFVNRFNLNGQQNRRLRVPDKYLPASSSGIRNNLAFESLTITPDERFLYTAVENALLQDGPQADLNQESLSRILKYDRKSGKTVAEVVYVVDAVPDEPVPDDAFRTNGLVELFAIDNNGTLLALERAFSVGIGNTVILYEVLGQGALDVQNEFSLFWEEAGLPFEIDPPVQKSEILNFADIVDTVDNLKGMTFGPKLKDGRQTLIVVSDNNFNDEQVSQFIALALELDSIPAARPVVETPRAIDEEDAASPLQGDSDDPAIWVHPKRPWKSLIIAT